MPHVPRGHARIQHRRTGFSQGETGSPLAPGGSSNVKVLLGKETGWSSIPSGFALSETSPVSAGELTTHSFTIFMATKLLAFALLLIIGLVRRRAKARSLVAINIVKE